LSALSSLRRYHILLQHDKNKELDNFDEKILVDKQNNKIHGLLPIIKEMIEEIIHSKQYTTPKSIVYMMSPYF
jgi:hypothetical protein